MKNFLSASLLALLPSAVFAQDVNVAKVSVDTVSTATTIVTYPLLERLEGEEREMIEELKYDEAQKYLEKKLLAAKRKKQPTEDIQADIDRVKNSSIFLKGTDKVLVFDSLVIAKDQVVNFFSNFEWLGSFQSSVDNPETIVFTTERGMVFSAKRDKGSNLNLFVKMDDGIGKHTGEFLKGLSEEADNNYPFIMPDGITMYFASRSEEGIGNYDIYRTLLNEDTGEFFKPENMGFPYNSPFNDYLMVVDELNGVGYFVSDRYQPEGKACVYFFVPNESRNPVDYESESRQNVLAAASLKSIGATVNDSNRKDADKFKALVSELKMNAEALSDDYDFTFVVNDSKVCHTLADFKKEDSRKICADWLQKSRNIDSLNDMLSKLRSDYHQASAGDKEKMTKKILEMEKRICELAEQTKELAKKIRRTELN